MSREPLRVCLAPGALVVVDAQDLTRASDRGDQAAVGPDGDHPCDDLLGTSPEIAFDRRYPAEYRIGSYLVRMSERMTESFDEGEHVGVTDFFFGPQPAWGPLPFFSDALDVDTWRPRLLRAMWESASHALVEARCVTMLVGTPRNSRWTPCRCGRPASKFSRSISFAIRVTSSPHGERPRRRHRALGERC